MAESKGATQAHAQKLKACFYMTCTEGELKKPGSCSAPGVREGDRSHSKRTHYAEVAGLPVPAL